MKQHKEVRGRWSSTRNPWLQELQSLKKKEPKPMTRKRRIHLVETYSTYKTGMRTYCKKLRGSTTNSPFHTTCRNCLYKYLKQILDWEMICKFYDERMDRRQT